MATAGRIDVEPGVTNVIPGTAGVRVELRGIDDSRLARVGDDVETAARAAAAEYGLTVALAPWDHVPVTPLDPHLVKAALAAAVRRGVHAVGMPSWAGHDAKILAPHVPAGLLFVPSRDGMSHAPDEYTAPGDLARGAQLLLDTVREADHYLAQH